MKFSIIIPVYNEGKTIAEVLRKVVKTKLPGNIRKEIVVVDDGSTDNSKFEIQKTKFRNLFFWHWLGNRFLNLVINLLYNTTLSDMEVGYKVFKTEILQEIDWKAARFDFEPEVTAKTLKKGIRIYEVPISYAGRDYSEGKKISGLDGLIALWTLIKYRFGEN